MAYCNECGAYIPDGHSKCLACGMDVNAEKQGNAQAYEYKYEEVKNDNSDFLKKQLEEQRRRQQENSRKWAETERAQREKNRQKQEGYSYTKAARSTDNKKYAAPGDIDASKILAAISYFGALFIVPYIFFNKDEFAMYHAKQGFILFVSGLIADIAGSILGIKWIVGLIKIYFIVKGVATVLQGRKEPLPYIGTLF